MICQLVQQAWQRGDSVLEAFAQAWDEGVMIASQRSWHRFANLMNQASRPAQRTKKNRRKRLPPVVVASRPHQAWSWDITELPGPNVHTRFRVYQITDLWSRKVIAWTVSEHESKTIAAELFDEAMSRLGVPEVVHSDSGSAMRSTELRDIVEGKYWSKLSFSRPRVSDDNPFSEATFRILKYRVNYPVVFEDLEHAKNWTHEFYTWFNNSHHHGSLALFTPSQLEDGTWKQIHAKRQEILDQYYQEHPERFREPPKAPKPKPITGINLDRK